jgi:type II secretory pathway component PulM
MPEKDQVREREVILELLKQLLSEMTDNPLDDIREESLIYGELNLTEFDLQRIIKEIANKIEIDGEQLSEMVHNNEEIVSVRDVLDLIVDEKELG